MKVSDVTYRTLSSMVFIWEPMLFIVTLVHCIFNIISLNLKHNKEYSITRNNSSSIQFLKGSCFFYIFTKQSTIKFTVHVKSWKKWHLVSFQLEKDTTWSLVIRRTCCKWHIWIFGVMYWLKGILSDVELKALSKFSKIWIFCIFS